MEPDYGYAQKDAVAVEEPLTYRLDCTTGRVASLITDLCNILDRTLGGSVVQMGGIASGIPTEPEPNNLRSVLSNLEQAENRLADQVHRARALA